MEGRRLLFTHFFFLGIYPLFLKYFQCCRVHTGILTYKSKSVWKSIPDHLYEMYGKCVNKEIFSSACTRVIVLLKPPHRVRSNSRCFRGISLDPTLEIVLERALVERLQENGESHSLQFGFREGSCVEDALRSFLCILWDPATSSTSSVCLWFSRGHLIRWAPSVVHSYETWWSSAEAARTAMQGLCVWGWLAYHGWSCVPGSHSACALLASEAAVWVSAWQGVSAWLQHKVNLCSTLAWPSDNGYAEWEFIEGGLGVHACKKKYFPSWFKQKFKIT